MYLKAIGKGFLTKPSPTLGSLPAGLNTLRSVCWAFEEDPVVEICQLVYAAYAYFFEVAWRSCLDDHSRDRAHACKTRGFHCHMLEPEKYATEIRGPRHIQLDFFFVHTRRQTELTKEGRSKWRSWPLRPVVSCTRDGADWPKVVAVGAQQPISDFFGFIQMRDTLSTNGEHLQVAEVKSFPAIPKSTRSVNGDQNGANLKKWSVLLVCTIQSKNRPKKIFIQSEVVGFRSLPSHPSKIAPRNFRRRFLETGPTVTWSVFAWEPDDETSSLFSDKKGSHFETLALKCTSGRGYAPQ